MDRAGGGGARDAGAGEGRARRSGRAALARRAALLRLCRWIADYYVAPLGQVLRTALPAALCDSSTDYLVLARRGRRGRGGAHAAGGAAAGVAAGKDGPQPVARLRRECGDRVWWPAIRRLEESGVAAGGDGGRRGRRRPVRTRRVLRLTRELPSLRERGVLFARARRQRECCELVESLGGVAESGAPDAAAALLALRAERAGGEGGGGASRRRRCRATRTRGSVAPPPAPHDPHAAPGGGGRGAGGGQPRRRRPGHLPPARRHRLRQDAGLHRAAPRGGGAAGADRDRAGARDRAHPADGGTLQGRLRRPGGGAPLRALRRRALRRVARAALGREADRGGRALRRLRAAAGPRAPSWWTRSTRARYKQADAPRYHAREVAVVRAQLEGARLRARLRHPLAGELDERAPRASTGSSSSPSGWAGSRSRPSGWWTFAPSGSGRRSRSPARSRRRRR